MGEYVQYRGERLKLGTCEDLFYTRFDQLESAIPWMHKLDGNLEPKEYINPELGWCCRFPFPEEDGTQIGCYEDFDKGLLIGVPWDSPLAKDVDHRDIAVPLHPRGGGYNVNVFVPCLVTIRATHPQPLKTSPFPDVCPVLIKQQKLMPDGHLWTILECDWCQQAYRLEPESGVALADHLREQAQRADKDYWNVVADRVLAGYHRNGVLA